MPTGITQAIYEGEETSFEQFAWRCARQFGSLAHLREEPNAPIPERVEKPTDWNDEQLAKARDELADAESWTPERAEEMAEKVHQAAVDRIEEANSKMDEVRARYEAVLEKAKAWELPTPDHEGLKKLMIKQLEQSIEHDCSRIDLPAKLSGEDLRAKTIEHAKRAIEYHEERLEEIKNHAKASTAWLEALRDSIGAPA